MGLDIERINNFLDELEFFSDMWSSIHIASIAYKRKNSKEWICLSILFYMSEKKLDTKIDVKYNIPDRLVIIHQDKKFSLKDLKNTFRCLASGSLRIGNFKLTVTGFKTINHIKERRPGWHREGLADIEGWPALILRNYEENNILTIDDITEIEDLLKKHKTEPYNDLSEVTSKYLGFRISGGKKGAIYCVAPIYLKLEGVKLDAKGNLAVTIVAHKCIRPSELSLNVVLTGASNEIESRRLNLTETPRRRGNFWAIKKIIPSKINVIDARLYLIYRDEIVFSDWARREDKEKELKEESEVKRWLPQTEDELRDKIVIPLLRKMGFQQVRARPFHGPGEHGADILPFYKINEFGIREYYAVQIKTKKLRGGAKGNVIEVLRQYDSAMNVEWHDLKEGITYRLDHFILVALHGATQDAEKQLFEWPRRMGTRRLIYITGIDLIDLLKKYEL